MITSEFYKFTPKPSYTHQSSPYIILKYASYPICSCLSETLICLMGNVQFNSINYLYKGKLLRMKGIEIGRTDIKDTYTVHTYETYQCI